MQFFKPFLPLTFFKAGCHLIDGIVKVIIYSHIAKFSKSYTKSRIYCLVLNYIYIYSEISGRDYIQVIQIKVHA